jgi:hypothetical protein
MVVGPESTTGEHGAGKAVGINPADAERAELNPLGQGLHFAVLGDARSRQLVDEPQNLPAVPERATRDLSLDEAMHEHVFSEEQLLEMPQAASRVMHPHDVSTRIPPPCVPAAYVGPA